ncbi:MAG: SGNH/GDSL hydrolase family protein [Eubacteriales bacterium]
MFENEFNLKFNLHKAYVDIGLSDEDPIRLAQAYGIKPEEIEAILEGFALENKKNAQAVLEDYAQIKISSKEMKIAYIGDSITSDRISHQRIMQAALSPYKNIQIKDFSVSGWKVSDVLTAYYPGIGTFAPDIAVVMIGTNDMRITDDEFQYNHTSSTEFERDLVYVIKKLTGSGCRVILCTLPPFCMEKMTPALSDWKILYKQTDLDKYNGVIIETAKENKCTLVDMRGIYSRYNPSDITIDDGLHLNSAGQTLLTKEVFKALYSMLQA